MAWYHFFKGRMQPISAPPRDASKGPVQAQPSFTAQNLMQNLNVYTPHQYATMPEGEKRASLRGFEAGRQYEASLRDATPDADGWVLVDPATVPLGEKLETKRKGEAGTNICFCRWVTAETRELEWVEYKTGVTTITHHSFAAPTHWRKPL